MPLKDTPVELAAAPPERRAGGRHLDTSRDDALRRASLRLLATIGYDRLTVDAVAQEAGAGKATIYRRWAGKAELVVDALTCAKFPLAVPDTGSLRGDLLALASISTAREGAMDAQVLIGLASALPRDAELRKVFRQGMIAPHVAMVTAVFARAVERGEIAPVVNIELVISIFPALVVHRLLLLGIAPSPSFAEEVIDDIILPLVSMAHATTTSASASSDHQ